MKKLDAYLVYLSMEGGMSFFLSGIFAANLIYQVTTVGLNPLQLVLVGTVLEATAFLCEVPTGVVADVYSRRLSIIIGYLMIGGLLFGCAKYAAVTPKPAEMSDLHEALPDGAH